jgi:glucose-1-phosphate cytidylyltransferase
VQGKDAGGDMKVVLFCGGLGTRLREHSDTIPKPLVNVGRRPIIWHLMRYYAHFGHKDFVLALGYRGDLIREYFLNYDECLTNDFTMSDGGKKIHLLNEDIRDWRITFVDTGMHSNIGQRLLRVRDHLQDEETFLANYSDGLSDLPLDRMVSHFKQNTWEASFLAVRSPQSFHLVSSESNGEVTKLGPMQDDSVLINGGFFVMRSSALERIREGEELVEQPFARMIAERKLGCYRHAGFWQAMDTFKDKIQYDRMEARGDCPWMLWKPR